MSIAALLAGPLRVVNIGLESFARDLAANGAAVAQVDWSPPRKEDPANGCQQNTIRNCHIQLSRFNNAPGSGPAADG